MVPEPTPPPPPPRELKRSPPSDAEAGGSLGGGRSHAPPETARSTASTRRLHGALSTASAHRVLEMA